MLPDGDDCLCDRLHGLCDTCDACARRERFWALATLAPLVLAVGFRVYVYWSGR